jgi:hypothetical protein
MNYKQQLSLLGSVGALGLGVYVASKYAIF